MSVSGGRRSGGAQDAKDAAAPRRGFFERQHFMHKPWRAQFKRNLGQRLAAGKTATDCVRIDARERPRRRGASQPRTRPKGGRREELAFQPAAPSVRIRQRPQRRHRRAEGFRSLATTPPQSDRRALYMRDHTSERASDKCLNRQPKRTGVGAQRGSPLDVPTISDYAAMTRGDPPSANLYVRRALTGPAGARSWPRLSHLFAAGIKPGWGCHKQFIGVTYSAPPAVKPAALSPAPLIGLRGANKRDTQ